LENLPDLLPDLVFTGIRVTGEKKQINFGGLNSKLQPYDDSQKNNIDFDNRSFRTDSFRHKLTSEILITKPDGSK
jgi:hypothetical protein